MKIVFYFLDPFDINKLTQTQVTTTRKSVSVTLAETSLPTTLTQVITTPNTAVPSTLPNSFTTPNLTISTKEGTNNGTTTAYPATNQTYSSTINIRAANKTDASLVIIIPVAAAIVLIILLFTFCLWTKRKR